MSLQPNPTAVILDTETTAAKETPERRIEVIELAYRDTHDREFFHRRYKPSMPPQWGALAVHGITMSELEDCPPSSQALLDSPLRATFWIGHNIDFDWRALGSPPQVRRICTLALARALWPELDSHTLTVMMYFIKGAAPATRELLRSAHSAAADIDFCEDLLQVIMQVAKVRDLETLWELSEEARIPKKMTFGKHAGKLVSEVDRGYANWYRGQPDADPYLIAAFRQHGLIR
jgi:exodeoxyribonuclease X